MLFYDAIYINNKENKGFALVHPPTSITKSLAKRTFRLKNKTAHAF